MQNKKHTPVSMKSDNLNIRIMSRTSVSDSPSAPDIIFETIHPDDKENNYIFTFINPDTFFSHTYKLNDPQSPITYQQLHYHDFFELIYVISGTMYQQIETERHLYPAGSLCLLNCFISHQEEYSTDFRALFLRLPIPLVKTLLHDINNFYFEIEQNYMNRLVEHFFENTLNLPEQSYSLRKEYLDFIPKKEFPGARQYMYHLFDSLTRQITNPTIGSTYIVRCILMQILCELSDSSHYQIIPLNLGTDAETELFQAIRNQIQNHHGHISRQELETTLSYSGSYLNRIVKKYTGYSIKQYALSISLKEAVDLLQSTDMPVNEICNTLHFSNLTYFYSSFQKKYGTTPKKYRENYRNFPGI